jgi:NADH dehydrogenase FAD-containing subunit
VKRLVLVGGGHAHLEVLRHAARRRFRDTEIVLVSPFAAHHYSSMVPGFLQASYRESEFAFDLGALCAAAGARFVERWADDVDGPGRTVRVDGAGLEFDAASLDVGSDPAGLDVAGVRDHGHTVRPMSRAVALSAALDSLAATRPAREVGVCIVGGGAAGAEVAWAVDRRLRGGGHRPRVALVEREPQLLPEYAPPARRRARYLLERRGVRVVLGRDVAAVGAQAVTLHGGEQIPSVLTVWLTGAAPNEVVRRSALAKDRRGFVLVDATLREANGAPVWGAGDCVTPLGHLDTPKAGVYAVREGPVLAANLRAACEGGGATRRFTPQPHFLALLNTGDGHALLRWHGVLSHSRAAWRLKDWIDRRYVRRYQRLYRAPT